MPGHRPLQPVNGVIVAIGVDELIRSDCARIDAHARAVRRRLVELRRTLEVAVPVYVMLTKADLLAGRPVLAFLGHTGNWDLAGVWCARHLGTVVTVAERLEPEEMFRAFLDYRESLGMVIHPAEHGTFARLREQLATGEPVVMPLLADRDLSATGVEVDLCGHRARMAAGPAALAVETGLPLYPVTLRHERLGRTWGMVVTIHDAVDVPSAECADAVGRTTQACADAFGRAITEHTEDWHVMQRVFTDDLPRRRPG